MNRTHCLHLRQADESVFETQSDAFVERFRDPAMAPFSNDSERKAKASSQVAAGAASVPHKHSHAASSGIAPTSLGQSASFKRNA